MTPKSPDPYQTAAAQTGSNRDSSIASALINNYDENSPFGNVRYTQNGTQSYTDANGQTVSVPKFTRSVNLSPDQQGLLDRQNKAGLNLGDLAVSQSARLNTVMNSPMDTSGLPSMPGSVNLQQNPGLVTGAGLMTNIGPQDYSADRRRVEDAMMSRFNEDFSRDEAASQTRLVNQGLTPGSEAWNNEMTRLDRARNDARTQATLAGGQEQSRLAGLELQQAQFGNNARLQEGQFGNTARLDSANFGNNAQLQQQGANSTLRSGALQEQLALRNQPINEIAALLSGSQINVPQFASGYQQGIGAAPIGQYINDDYQNRLAQNNATLSGMFGLGSSAIRGAFGLL